MKRSIKILAVGTIMFLICGAPDIYFDALYPARVDLPKHIKKLGLVDRSQHNNKIQNILEGGITGEGIGQDKLSSQICLDGVYDQLRSSELYNIKRTNLMYKRKGLGMDFPPPMKWDRLDSICQAYDLDALIVLEVFDTDYVGAMAEINLGFRLYDPGNKVILDRFSFVHSFDWNKPIRDVSDVVFKIIEKEDAFREASYYTGQEYARRLSPTWFRIERKYYKRAKRDENLAYGARMMEVNDWESAIEALTEAATNGRHRKIRGRASHNLAVVYEILGEHEIAREWAQAAWGKYKNKDSKDYSYILSQRIKETERIKMQQKN